MKTLKNLLSIIILGVFFITPNVIADPGGNNNETFTIVEHANASEELKTLFAAVRVSDLTEILQSDGPFTIFAPSDEAFAKLPEGMLLSLINPDNKEDLIKLLANHVVIGEIKSTDLISGMTTKNVQGNSIQVDITDNRVKINGAKIITSDIKASNGIVHIVDQVILPPLK